MYVREHVCMNPNPHLLQSLSAHVTFPQRHTYSNTRMHTHTRLPLDPQSDHLSTFLTMSQSDRPYQTAGRRLTPLHAHLAYNLPLLLPLQSHSSPSLRHLGTRHAHLASARSHGCSRAAAHTEAARIVIRATVDQCAQVSTARAHSSVFHGTRQIQASVPRRIFGMALAHNTQKPAAGPVGAHA
jgi:hypothetical protein